MSQTVNASENEKERDRRVAGFWWWLTSIVALGALVFAGLYLGGYLDGYFAKRAAVKQKVDNAFVFTITGHDKAGRYATFDFMILQHDYTWVKGSTTNVAVGEQTVPDAEIIGRVITPPMRASLETGTDLIAVGLASQEGQREQEEERANQRGQTIATWLSQVGKPDQSILSLNLGQYNKSCQNQQDAETSFERPVMFAAVRKKDSGAELNEALADAITGKANLPSRECYSRFDMTKVR